MKLVDEFKKFISRGNVLDMAVGVIMGTAFTKIINALVTNILTPIISLLTGKVNLSTLTLKVSDALTFDYGLFLQAVLDFLLTAIAVFAIVKVVNTAHEKLERKQEPEPEAAPEPTKEEVLLTEIRDLLKEKQEV